MSEVGDRPGAVEEKLRRRERALGWAVFTLLALAVLGVLALMGKRASIHGTVLRARPLEEKATLARAFEARVIRGFEDGKLKPVVDKVFSAREVAAAHTYMEENRNFGKILLGW